MTKKWWQGIGEWFGRRTDSAGVPSPADQDGLGESLSRESVRQMVEGVLSTRPDEIGCDECFADLDRFAEYRLAGKNAQEAMPLVHDHLQRCPDCREEYEALLVALQQRE